MPNMSHCRFENTYNDLVECQDALFDASSIKSLENSVNKYEREYIRKLVKLCRDISEGFINEVEELDEGVDE
jgi:hypothetical protein